MANVFWFYSTIPKAVISWAWLVQNLICTPCWPYPMKWQTVILAHSDQLVSLPILAACVPIFTHMHPHYSSLLALFQLCYWDSCNFTVFLQGQNRVGTQEWWIGKRDSRIWNRQVRVHPAHCDSIARQRQCLSRRHFKDESLQLVRKGKSQCMVPVVNALIVYQPSLFSTTLPCNAPETTCSLACTLRDRSHRMHNISPC